MDNKKNAPNANDIEDGSSVANASTMDTDVVSALQNADEAPAEAATAPPAANPNRMMTPEDIAQLLAAQAAQEPAVEVPEADASVDEPELETPAEEVADVPVEIEIETPAANPNRMMTPEDIAQLLAAQDIPEPVVEVPEVEEPEPEPEALADEVVDAPVEVEVAPPAANPNRMMTPEDIAQLLAAQDVQEPVIEVPEVEAEVPEPEVLADEVVAAPVEVQVEPLAANPNRMMTPEDIAQLLAAQDILEPVIEVPEVEEPDPEPEARADEVVATPVEVQVEPPAANPNKMMTPEDIAQFLAAQDIPESVIEMPEAEAEAPEPEPEPEPEALAEEVVVAPIEVEVEPPAANPNKMMTPEDIAQLLAAQDIPEPVIEVPEVEASEPEPLAEEVVDAPVEVEVEPPAANPNRMMTPEDIAQLLAAQDIPEPVIEVPEVEASEPEPLAEEVVAAPVEVEPETPAANPNRMMTPEDIAQLLAAQDIPEPVIEVPEVEASEPEPLAEEVVDAPVEVEVEPPAANPNRMMTPEDIAQLLAAQDIPEPVIEVPEVEAPEPEALVEEVVAAPVEVETETPAANPNRMMTPEDIAQLLAAQDIPEPVIEVPEAEAPEPEALAEEVVAAPVEVEVEPPAANPNKMMTPEDIAQLLAAQDPQEPVVEVPEVESPEPEALAEEVVAAPVEVEVEPPTANPNKMMTPEDIAQLLAAQDIPEPVVEVPEVEAEAPEPEALAEEVVDAPVEVEVEPPVANPNRMMTPEDIAQLLAAQDIPEPVIEVPEVEAEAPEPEPEALADEVVDAPVEVEVEPPAANPNKMMTPEDIAQLLAAQDIPEPVIEVPEAEAPEPEILAEEVVDAHVEVEVEPPAANPNRMMTPEDIAQLLAAQDPQAPVVEVSEIEAEAPEPEALPEEVVDIPVEVEVEPSAANPNRMMTPEDIAQLLAAQDIAEPVIEVPEAEVEAPEPEALVDEVVAAPVEVEVEPPAANPTKMMTPEDIAQLLAAQDIPEPVIEVPEVEASEPEPLADEVVDAPVEVEVEPPIANPNRMMTPEDIAQLLAAQDIPEPVIEVPEVEAPEPEALAEEVVAAPVEVEVEPPAANPNKMMTPEDIAQLLAAQDIPEPVIEVPEVEEPEPEALADEVVAAPVEVEVEPPAANPNKMMTPEDIAQLLAAQDIPEPVVEVPEVEAPVPEAPAADPNRMLTPEDIAQLMAEQDAQEPLVEEPESAPSEPEPEPEPEPPVADPNRMLTPEDIAQLMAEQDAQDTVVEELESAPSEPEPEPPAADPNRMLTPEDIAQLMAEQDAQEPLVEELESAPSEPEPEPPAADPNRMLTPEDIAQLMAEQDEQEPVVEVPDSDEFELTPLPDDSEATMTNASVTPDHEAQAEVEDSSDDLNDIVKEKKDGFVQKVLLIIKKALSKKSKSVAEPLTEETDSSTDPTLPSDDADTSEKAKKSSVLKLIFAKLKRPSKKEKKPKAEPANESMDSESRDAEYKEPVAAVKPAKKSGLRSVLVVLMVLFLMSISFAGGFFSRDLMALIKPDSAHGETKVDAKAKAANDKKRAKELEKTDPKDYTSSMYLDSLILKGRAEKMTSIKLQKIDNIEKLAEFKNLRKIKLIGMKGDEDLRAIENLMGVEEISIENSVIKKQFSHGDFSSVTYMELFDTTVENPSQFANFKGLTDLDADTCKFPSAAGNLELTAYLPVIENLTLSNCGKYGELMGVKNLKELKSLNLTDNTLVKNMSYAENLKVKTAKVDISFAENIEQLHALAKFKNIKTLTIQVQDNHFSATQMTEFENWLTPALPNATVKFSSY